MPPSLLPLILSLREDTFTVTPALFVPSISAVQLELLLALLSK